MRKIKPGNDDNSLDLHGVKHADVKQTVINFIEGHWNKGHELTLVTGHSSAMKGLVLEVLDEYKLPYNIGDLYLGKVITNT